MIPQVQLTMKSGEKVLVEGYQSQIHDRVVQARKDGITMIDFELPLTPTGQKISIDPNEISMIRKDPYQ